MSQETNKDEVSEVEPPEDAVSVLGGLVVLVLIAGFGIWVDRSFFREEKTPIYGWRVADMGGTSFDSSQAAKLKHGELSREETLQRLKEILLMAMIERKLQKQGQSLYDNQVGENEWTTEIPTPKDDEAYTPYNAEIPGDPCAKKIGI